MTSRAPGPAAASAAGGGVALPRLTTAAYGQRPATRDGITATTTTSPRRGAPPTREAPLPATRRWSNAASSVSGRASTLGPLSSGPVDDHDGKRTPRLTPALEASVRRLASPRAPPAEGAWAPREFQLSAREVGAPVRGFFRAHTSSAAVAAAGASPQGSRPGTSASIAAGSSPRRATLPMPPAAATSSSSGVVLESPGRKSAAAAYAERLHSEHRDAWRNRKDHTATLLERLPASQRRATRTDLHRFDARLTRFDGRADVDRSNSARRQQHLLQRLFNLRLSNNCFVKRRLLDIGLEGVVQRLSQVCSRYAMRLLTADEFHLALSEALPEHEGEQVTHAESRLLFTLFDDDRSGIVDLEEFAEGLQLLLLSESVVLLAHCRNIIDDDHPASDAFVSALEVDLMFVAVVNFYKERAGRSDREAQLRPPAWHAALRAAMEDTKATLWHRAHKGQINLSDLQEAVQSHEVLHRAILGLPENGIADSDDDCDSTVRSRPATPDVDDVLEQMQRLARQRPTSSGERGPDDDGGGGGGGHEDESVAASDDRGGGKGIMYDTINVRNLRFRADEFKLPDETRHLAAGEHGDPAWYCRGGQVWRVVGGGAPEPMDAA